MNPRTRDLVERAVILACVVVTVALVGLSGLVRSDAAWSACLGGALGAASAAVVVAVVRERAPRDPWRGNRL